ncbi:MAG: NUDIX domain-containing protein [Desulfurococcales archaeon]|nr:NUDIX domain-containing protein [Desulfurococcales archaeon]
MKAAVLVAYDNKGVLMVHKTCKDGYPWSCDLAFPGGRLKPGETIIEGALREAEEEVCMSSDNLKIRSILPLERPLNVPDIIVYPVLAEMLPGATKHVCSNEIDKILIVPWNKVCSFRLEPWVHPLRKIAIEGIVLKEGLAVWGMSLRILKRVKDLMCRDWD